MQIKLSYIFIIFIYFYNYFSNHIATKDAVEKKYITDIFIQNKLQCGLEILQDIFMLPGIPLKTDFTP